MKAFLPPIVCYFEHVDVYLFLQIIYETDLDSVCVLLEYEWEVEV